MSLLVRRVIVTDVDYIIDINEQWMVFQRVNVFIKSMFILRTVLNDSERVDFL